MWFIFGDVDPVVVVHVTPLMPNDLDSAGGLEVLQSSAHGSLGEPKMELTGSFRAYGWKVAVWMAGFLPLHANFEAFDEAPPYGALRFRVEFETLEQISTVAALLEFAKEARESNEEGFQRELEDAKSRLRELQTLATKPWGFRGLEQLPVYRFLVQTVEELDALH